MTDWGQGLQTTGLTNNSHLEYIKNLIIQLKKTNNPIRMWAKAPKRPYIKNCFYLCCCRQYVNGARNDSTAAPQAHRCNSEKAAEKDTSKGPRSWWPVLQLGLSQQLLNRETMGLHRDGERDSWEPLSTAGTRA